MYSQNYVADPRAAGAAQRKSQPRGALAQWDPSRRRQLPLEVLAHAMHGRVPALAALKLERMRTSAFGFFRGALPIMAYDLSLTGSTNVCVQLCGDAHVQNFGAYAGPDGRLIFDLDDFDETILGPFEWDIKRMATSILLVGGDAHLKTVSCLRSAEIFLDRYLDLVRQFSRMPILEVARYQVHRLAGVASISRILAQAERATPLHSLEHLTEKTRGGRRFKQQPPLLRRVSGKEASTVLRALVPYTQSLLPERRHFLAQFKPIDVAFKVVGTGSVGLRDYVIYLEGNGDTPAHADPLFLQVKEETTSAYVPYLHQPDAVASHQGKRVVEGQRAMQLQSDPLLGWTEFDGRDYLVRQLNDHKATLKTDRVKPRDLAQYAAVCGEMLARGHSRSGSAREIAGYLGNGKRFRSAMLDFAKAYAEQTVTDWKALCARAAV